MFTFHFNAFFFEMLISPVAVHKSGKCEKDLTEVIQQKEDVIEWIGVGQRKTTQRVCNGYEPQTVMSL